jgi:transcriptional regulator with GAF, ATPase, and Fis domain
MATFAPALAQIANECEAGGLTPENSVKLAAELAKVFKVRQEEVGILRVEKESLVFAHPVKLHNVGRIPLNSSAAVAVHTANSKKAEIINNFARTRHATFFEMVDVSGKDAQKKPTREEQIIQKMMSVPVIANSQSVGVIQICRKGATAPAAGPDFIPAELQKLIAIAASVAKCFK